MHPPLSKGSEQRGTPGLPHLLTSESRTELNATGESSPSERCCS